MNNKRKNIKNEVKRTRKINKNKKHSFNPF